MCGIAGIFNTNSREPVQPQMLTAMLRAVRHVRRHHRIHDERGRDCRACGAETPPAEPRHQPGLRFGRFPPAAHEAAPYHVGLDASESYINGNVDNYGAKVTGWIIPPTTGNWNFFIRSDDAASITGERLRVDAGRT